MKQSLILLKQGFESSSGKTPEFLAFFRTFKKEFTKELQFLGATNVQFSRGHFYLSGFFTLGTQAWYFSLSDVRGMDYVLQHNPDSCMAQLLYRSANDYKDYSGGANQYVRIESGMSAKMRVY